MSITILNQLNLHKRSNFIRKSTMTNKTQAFLEYRLTIELDNLSNLISTKTSHNESIKFLR
jgi:hypothetical protein